MVWLTHFPMLSLAERTQAYGLQYPGDLANLDQVAAPVLQRAAPTVVLHGHAHIRDTVTAGPVLQLGIAALIEPPFDVSILEISPTGPPVVHWQSRSIIDPPPVALPVFSAADATWIWAAGRWSGHAMPPSVGPVQG